MQHGDNGHVMELFSMVDDNHQGCLRIVATCHDKHLALGGPPLTSTGFVVMIKRKEDTAKPRALKVALRKPI